MKAKTEDTILLCQFNLPFLNLWYPQIIEAQFTWQARLIVSGKLWYGSSHIGPLGESFAPPFIVFSYWMKLRQIKGYELYVSLNLFLRQIRNIVRAHVGIRVI